MRPTTVTANAEATQTNSRIGTVQGERGFEAGQIGAAVTAHRRGRDDTLGVERALADVAHDALESVALVDHSPDPK